VEVGPKRPGLSAVAILGMYIHHQRNVELA
jgi:hypothetical protein